MQLIWRLVPDATAAAEVRVKRGRDEQAPVFVPGLELKTFSYVAPANNGFIVEQALFNLFPNLRPDKLYDNVDLVWKPSLFRTPDQVANVSSTSTATPAYQPSTRSLTQFWRLACTALYSVSPVQALSRTSRVRFLFSYF